MRTLDSILEASANYRNLRTVLLAGGVGGGRMALGLATVLAPESLTVVVNVADDDYFYGVLVCADLDTVCYTLAGINGPHGWGIAGDTTVVMEHLRSAGVDTAFQLGDADLAHCMARTMYLDAEGKLSDFTAAAARRIGVQATVLPASNDPVRTKVDTAAGSFDFQEYFVLRSHADAVTGLRYEGASSAVPAPGVLAAVAEADLVVIAPSNPPLSIWPMLAMSELRDAVARHPMVVAVSPLIGGKAVKGPLVDVMTGLGLEPTTAGIAAAYADIDLRYLVVHEEDAADSSLDVGPEIVPAQTLIGEPAAAAELADEIIRLSMTPS